MDLETHLGKLHSPSLEHKPFWLKSREISIILLYSIL